MIQYTAIQQDKTEIVQHQTCDQVCISFDSPQCNMTLLTTLILTSIWFSLTSCWLAQDASLCSKYKNISSLIFSRYHPSRPNWRIKNLPGSHLLSSPLLYLARLSGTGELQYDRNNPVGQPSLRVFRLLLVSTILPRSDIYGFLQASKQVLSRVCSLQLRQPQTLCFIKLSPLKQKKIVLKSTI